MTTVAASRLFSLRILFGLAGCLLLNLPDRADGETRIAPAKPAAASLHERIDELLEADSLAPRSATADDAEFLRRIYFDLLGIPPTAAETREFLDDKSLGKRAALIDRLLAGPQHAWHMATTFDVTWNERRADKVIKHVQWFDFLYQSFYDNKPYDQLVREVLAGDDVTEAVRPASKFYYDRDCEPNTMTRDIGRLFFGMDMQCAQCHDHPLVDDYLIGDYYGLYAFVSRTYLHNDRKTRSTSIAEKAEGEANYKSVFTGESADKVVPQVPRGKSVVEPVYKKGDEYTVKPDKDVKPVPKFSRRAKLAELATDGSNEMFDRNAVNRIYAHLFGRGLVHPVDFMHPDNPPSHPEVLDLLARDFHEHHYDLRRLMRELTLTRAYQRASQLPSPADLTLGLAAKRLPKLEAEHEKLKAEVASASSVEKPDAAAVAELRRLRTALNAASKRIDEAKLVIEFERLAQGKDRAAAARAWDGLIQLWSERTDVGLLRPLTPEMFALGIMQAAGVTAGTEAKARDTLAKSPPKEMKAAAADEKPKLEAMYIAKQTIEPLRGSVQRFVDLYAEAPGADFGATLNQALFFGNGGMVEGFLKPSGNNLTARLVKLSDSAALADEMYLTVLTRRPDPAETTEVAKFLKGRDDDRAAAVQEMVWALLGGNEFRFNH